MSCSCFLFIWKTDRFNFQVHTNSLETAKFWHFNIWKCWIVLHNEVRELQSANTIENTWHLSCQIINFYKLKIISFICQREKAISISVKLFSVFFLVILTTSEWADLFYWKQKRYSFRTKSKNKSQNFEDLSV
jgi:hypothetical protein